VKYLESEGRHTGQANIQITGRDLILKEGGGQNARKKEREIHWNSSTWVEAKVPGSCSCQWKPPSGKGRKMAE